MSSVYKPQIRQEGFQLPSPPPQSNNSPPPDYRFAPNSMDFSDELASLIASSAERSTHTPPPAQQQVHSNNDFHNPHRTHNIFDISAPASASSAFHLQHSTSSSSRDHHIHDFSPHSHFNSTLPALNSSMRYDPHPDPPPSSYQYNGNGRAASPGSRSRSRSRPSTSSGGSAGGGAVSNGGGVGPQRTRSRRGNSFSSVSPPPKPHPHAIVIPGSGRAANNGGAGWFVPSQSQPNEYALPTPDSLHSPLHSHPLSVPSHQQQYNSFGFPNDSHPHHPQSHHQSHMHQLSPQLSSLPSPTNINNLNSFAALGFGPNGQPSANGVGSLGHQHPMSSSLHSHHTVGATPASPISATGITSNPATPSANPNPLSPADKQAMLANEKRRRRRESHNAVERRRRDNINEKISELATLIPECMLEGSTTPGANGAPGGSGDDDDKKDNEGDGENTSPTGAGSAAANTAGIVKANKGMILRKSVEYIRYLQQLVSVQGARNRQLEAELKQYRPGAVTPSASTDDGSNPNNNFLSMNGDYVFSSLGMGGLESMPEDEEMMEHDNDANDSSSAGGRRDDEVVDVDDEAAAAAAAPTTGARGRRSARRTVVKKEHDEAAKLESEANGREEMQMQT